MDEKIHSIEQLLFALLGQVGSGRISFAKIKRHGLQNSGRMKSRHTIPKGDSKPCPTRLYS